MTGEAPTILVLRKPIEPHELARLLVMFEDMVKYVVDVERGIAAVGGELHADAEETLLAEGSRQEHLWGANYYPGRGAADCIDFTALINIRPAHDNRSMLIEDPAIRERVRAVTFALIGHGEPLP
jgi:hypothetical protein